MHEDSGTTTSWTVPGSAGTAVRFTPDCRWLVIGTKRGEVNCWDLSASSRNEPRVRRKLGSSSVLSLEISPDGRWLAACVAEKEDSTSGEATFLSEISKEDPLHNVTRLPSGVAARAERIAFSHDGKWLVAADWESGACLWHLYPDKRPSSPINLPTAGVCAVAFNASNTALATGGFDGITRVWPLTSKVQPVAPRVLVAHDGPINVIRFSANERWLATGNEHPHASGVVRVWEVGGRDALTRRGDTGCRLHQRQRRSDLLIGRATIGLPSRNRRNSSPRSCAD